VRALVFGFFLWFCCLVVAICRVFGLRLIGFCLWVFKLGYPCILSNVPRAALRFFIIYYYYYFYFYIYNLLIKKKKKKKWKLEPVGSICDLLYSNILLGKGEDP
jgi:hypothetical protein